MSGLRFTALAAVMGLMSLVGSFTAVAVFAGTGTKVSAEGESNVVQATEFQLLDGKGKTRGVWGVTEEGMGLLSLLDKREIRAFPLHLTTRAARLSRSTTATASHV